MMVERMESSLNQAHQQQRKAEGFLRNGKFEESIECHKKAAELLLEAMNLCQAERIQESLQLQHDYHIRQQAVIRFKQKQAEDRFKAFQKKQLEEADRNELEKTILGSPSIFSEGIQCAIYRTLEEQDSLLQFLFQERQLDSSAATQDYKSESMKRSSTPDEIISSGVKTPKNDKMVIEELQVHNTELRKLIHQLVTELEVVQKENRELKSSISNMHSQLIELSSKPTRLKEISDSSSPFVISPCSELSPIGLRELPPLAPLEMPDFDFSQLKFSSSQSESITENKTIT